MMQKNMAGEGSDPSREELGFDWLPLTLREQLVVLLFF